MRVLFFIFMLAAFPAMAAPGDTCADLTASLSKFTGGTPLRVNSNGQTYKNLFDTCDAKDRFAGRPLPLSRGREVSCSKDRNRVAYLVKYPDGTISFSAKAAVDADGSKLACGSGWPNLCATWLRFDQPGSVRKDVNAEDTPFVVIPRNVSLPKYGNLLPISISFRKDTRIERGDLAVAFTNGRCSFGVVGDSGPEFRLGEISLRSHVDLNNPQCKIKGQYPCKAIINGSGRGFPAGVNYLIFPHSRPVPLFSQSVNKVSRTQAEERVKAFIKKFERYR
jgi:hypothetical protein